jgi:membrane-bound serine protease (ClpP class)
MSVRRLPVAFITLVWLLIAPRAISQEPAPTQPSPAKSKPVYVIPIHGEIDPPLVVFIRRNVEEARDSGAATVIFDIDTFGGRVDSALQITTVIGSLTNIRTIAYVNVTPEGTGVSWSAGAIISLACDEIYMAPGTSMGAAAPVFQGASGTMEMAPEKTVSAVRTQSAALAEKNGHSVGVALAMVDQEVELVEVYVDGELQAMTAEDFEAASRRAEGTDTTIEKGKVISASGKLLSLTAGEMERYGVSSGTVASREELLEELGLEDREVIRNDPTASDQVVAILTGAGFSSLLILVGLVALFMEITSPGFGIPGTVAIAAFAVLFASNFLLGTVGSFELLMFLLGIVLLVLEIFVIPGFGIAGISGIILVVFALILSMQGFVVPEFEWEWQRFHRNVLIVAGNLAGAFAVFAVVAKYINRMPMFKRLLLSTSQESSAGYTVQMEDESHRLTGRTGEAITTLRPVGKAEIDDEVMVVESEGEFIESGSRIEVIAVNGNRVVVRGV